MTGVTLDCVNCGGRFVRGYITACCDNPAERTTEPSAKPAPADAPREKLALRAAVATLVMEKLANLVPEPSIDWLVLAEQVGAEIGRVQSERAKLHVELAQLRTERGEAVRKVDSLNASWNRESELRAEFEKEATNLEAERDAFDKDGSEQMWRANRAEKEVKRLRGLLPGEDEDESAAWLRLVLAHRKSQDRADKAEKQLAEALASPRDEREDALPERCELCRRAERHHTPRCPTEWHWQVAVAWHPENVFTPPTTDPA